MDDDNAALVKGENKTEGEPPEENTAMSVDQPKSPEAEKTVVDPNLKLDSTFNDSYNFDNVPVVVLTDFLDYNGRRRNKRLKKMAENAETKCLVTVEKKETVSPESLGNFVQDSVPSLPGGNSMPSVSKVQDVPSLSGGNSMPSVSKVQDVPSSPGGNSMPSVSKVQDVPSLPGGNSMPSVSKVQDVPSLPGGNSMSSVSKVQDVVSSQDMVDNKDDVLQSAVESKDLIQTSEAN